jgi:hypothetical protein
MSLHHAMAMRNKAKKICFKKHDWQHEEIGEGNRGLSQVNPSKLGKAR